MRIDRLTLRGLSSAFPGEVDLNLAGLDPGLVAVVGPNGGGKTTLLEATPAALYRQLPARNGVDPITYATTADSSIVEDFTIDGVVYRITLSMNGLTRKAGALLQVWDASTKAWVDQNDGKVTTFDAAIKAAGFPSFDLFINSAFAAQGRADEFTRRKPSQRKDLFSEFLNLQASLAMAATAAEAADYASDARLRLTVAVEILERETAPEVLALCDTRANALQSEGGHAELRKVELKARLADLETRLAGLAEQAAAHTTAVVRYHTLETENATRRGERQQLVAELAAVDVTLAADLQRLGQRLGVTIAEIEKKLAGNEEIQKRADEIRAAGVAVDALGSALRTERTGQENEATKRQRAERERREAEQHLAALKQTENTLTRAKADVKLLADVPCGGEGVFAACQFLQNAKAAEARIGALETELRPKAKLADLIGALTREIDKLTAAGVKRQARIVKVEAQITDLEQTAKYLAALEASSARIAELTAQKEQTGTKYSADVADAHARADARRAGIGTQAKAVNAEITRLEAAAAAAAGTMDATADAAAQAGVLQADLARVRADWDDATSMLAMVASQRDELQRQRAEIKAKLARLEVLRERLAHVEQELVEWRDLARALGKGGLPDLEIDAAGPSISALTNELLLSCFGARFSLELVTQVAKADGSGQKDLFTVAVTDNEAGGTRDIGMLSGGEKVIVQEALMAAIAIYVNQRSGMPIRTLWRDETGAALDPDNALRYVAMLRKVRELGGFRHVFFISHTPAAAALADAQIRVGDGTATIVLAPFAEAA